MRVAGKFLRRVGIALCFGLGLVAVGPSSVMAVTSTPFEWSISGPPGIRFSGVATSSTGAIVYAVPDPACGGGVAAKGYRSTNGGVTWDELSTMPDRFWISVDTSADGQKVVATGFVCVAGVPTQSEVFRSVDAGITWSVALAFDPSSPATVYGDVSTSSDGSRIVVGSNTGVFYSADSGLSWSPISGSDVRGVAISGDGATVMIAEHFGSLLASTDAGLSWSVTEPTIRNWSNIELSTDGRSALAVADRNGSNGGAFYTHDGGGTWVDAGLNSTFVDVQLAAGAMSPNGRTMIASSYYSDPYVSTDGGATWAVIPSEFRGVILNAWTAFAVADPDATNTANSIESRIFAVTENYFIARFDFPEPLTDLPATGMKVSYSFAVFLMIAGTTMIALQRRLLRGR